MERRQPAVGKQESPPPRDEASACTLHDGERLDRVARIRAEILPHVQASEPLTDGFAWDCEAEGREKIERWIALERSCCAHVSFELTPRPDGSLRLEVRGDDPAVGVLASLVASGDVASR